jgi:hypothetical protein
MRFLTIVFMMDSFSQWNPGNMPGGSAFGDATAGSSAERFANDSREPVRNGTANAEFSDILVGDLTVV